MEEILFRQGAEGFLGTNRCSIQLIVLCFVFNVDQENLTQFIDAAIYKRKQAEMCNLFSSKFSEAALCFYNPIACTVYDKNSLLCTASVIPANHNDTHQTTARTTA